MRAPEFSQLSSCPMICRSAIRYHNMLGGAEYWTYTAVTFADHGIKLRSLDNTPTLQLVFLQMSLMCSLNASLLSMVYAELNFDIYLQQ